MFDVCHLQSQGTRGMAQLLSCPSTITAFILWLSVLLLSSPGFKVGSTPPPALPTPCSKAWESGGGLLAPGRGD